MHVYPISSGRTAAALATLSLVFAGCSSGEDAGASPVNTSTTAPGTPSAEPGGAGATPASSEAPASAAGGTGNGGGDTGPAAAPGTGRFVVNGTTYDITITECSFQDDGPTKGSFEIKGTEAGGASFDMVQFYLSDDWSQTSVQLDFGPTNIYVIRSSATEGASPATVDGSNVTWIETFKELDVAANSQEARGQGVVNLTCA